MSLFWFILFFSATRTGTLYKEKFSFYIFIIVQFQQWQLATCVISFIIIWGKEKLILLVQFSINRQFSTKYRTNGSKSGDLSKLQYVLGKNMSCWNITWWKQAVFDASHRNVFSWFEFLTSSIGIKYHHIGSRQLFFFQQ